VDVIIGVGEGVVRCEGGDLVGETQ
jgi:hypothetical protein